MGHINEIRVLGYADDTAMISRCTEELTERLTAFTDKSLSEVDMKVKLSKTFNHHIRVQDKLIKASDAEIKSIEKKFEFKYIFAKTGCQQKFKTKRGMRIHSVSCQFDIGCSDKNFEVDKVVTVFDKKKTHRLYKVQWASHTPR